MLPQLLPGIYLGWGLGSNDGANVFGPALGAGLIRYRHAIIITAIFVLLGALLEGGKCLGTVGGITDLVSTTAIIASLSAAFVVHLMTFLRLPVSTSQAIMGSLVGCGLITRSPLDYERLSKVILSWIWTPVGAAIIAFFLYKILGYFWQRTVKNLYVFNLIIKIGALVLGSYAAYNLGANNVANTTGVFVAAGVISPFFALLLGGISISAGVLTYSKRVMQTVGKKIVPLGPFSSLIVILAMAITLHLYTQIGVPVSSSQAIVGAVVGVGLVKSAKMINRATLLYIFLGWIFSFSLAILFAYILGIFILR